MWIRPALGRLFWGLQWAIGSSAAAWAGHAAPCSLLSLTLTSSRWFLHVSYQTWSAQHCCAGEGYGSVLFTLAFSWSWVISQRDPSGRTAILVNAQHPKQIHQVWLCCLESDSGTQQILWHSQYWLGVSVASCCQWISAQTESIQVFISLPGLSQSVKRVVNLIRYSIGMPNHCKFSLISFSSSFWCMLVATAPFPYQ